jgi:hypothetical protein
VALEVLFAIKEFDSVMKEFFRRRMAAIRHDKLATTITFVSGGTDASSSRANTDN